MNIREAASEFAILTNCDEAEARRQVVRGCKLGILETAADLLVRKVNGVLEEIEDCALDPQHWRVSVFDWGNDILIADNTIGLNVSRHKQQRDIIFVRALAIRIWNQSSGFTKLAEYLRSQQLLAPPCLPPGFSHGGTNGDDSVAIKKRGRRPGSGGKAEADKPLIDEIKKLRCLDKDLSVSAAANLVLDRLEGRKPSAHRAADVRRLQRRHDASDTAN